MARFNYQRAIAGGMTDAEINQFLDSERAEGREYEVDPAAFPALRKARADMMAAEEPGAEANPLSPLDFLSFGAPSARPIDATVNLGEKAVRGVASRLAGRGAQAAAGGPVREGLETAGELVGGLPGMAARVSRFFRGSPPTPTSPPPGMIVGRAPAPAFSAPSSTASQALPEAVGSRIAAAGESGAKGASEAGRSLARQRWAKAGKPKPAAKAEPVKPRHDVKYFSESKGKHVDIEDMNQKHIEQAYRKLAATKPKPGSVADRVMNALLEESKHRLQTTGIHIGQTSQRGAAKAVKLPKPVQKRIAAVQRAAKPPRPGPESLEETLRKSIDLGRELEKRGLSTSQRNEAFRVLREQME